MNFLNEYEYEYEYGLSFLNEYEYEYEYIHEYSWICDYWVYPLFWCFVCAAVSDCILGQQTTLICT